MSVRVVLVRPWTDAHGGSGCCGGDARHGICFEGRVDVDGRSGQHGRDVQMVAEAFRRLKAQFPTVDVQIVGANNTAYLLPSTFRSVRRRHGVFAALREANRATTAGAVLIDGQRVGDLADLGVDGLLHRVEGMLTRARANQAWDG